MNWPFRKKDDKKEEEKWAIWQEEQPERSRFAYFIELPFYMKVFVIFAVLLALNMVLFLPLGLTAELFELWLAFIQALRLMIPLWLAFVLMVFAALFGIYLIPRVEFADIDEKYIYFKQNSDGNRHRFLTTEGWKGCSEAFVRKVGFFRYSVIGSIEAITESKWNGKPIEIYESKNLEVSQDLALLAENRHLKRRINQMERDQRNTSVSKLLDMLGSFMEKAKERK